MLFKSARSFSLALLIVGSLSFTQTEGQTQLPSQPTQTDAAATAQPLTYGLVVDNSGSLRANINYVIDAAKIFVEANRAEDETFVVRFVASEQVQVIQDLTRNKRRLERVMDDMYVEGGQTAVIDAVYLSADYLTKNAPEDANRRRALVLMTDGEDRGSFYKPEQLLQVLRDKKIAVYVLGFPEEVKRGQGGKKAYEAAVALLNTLAKESGGRAVLVRNTSELEAGAVELLKHLRNN